MASKSNDRFSFFSLLKQGSSVLDCLFGFTISCSWIETKVFLKINSQHIREELHTNENNT